MSRLSAGTSRWLAPYWSTGAITLLTLGVLLAGWWLISQWYQALLLAERRAYVLTELIHYQNILITAVNRRQVLLDSLRTVEQTDLKVLLNAHPLDLNVALRDNTEQVFYGPPELFQADPIIARIEWPEGAWEIAAIPTDGWQPSIQDSLTSFRAAGLFIVGLLASLVYLSTYRQAQLAEAVQQRTRELSQVNLKLQLDITERKQAEAALRESQAQLLEKEQRRRVAEGLREVLAVLNSKRPLPDILQHIVKQACQLLGSEAGALYRLDATQQLLHIQAAHNLPADYVMQLTVPLGLGVIGRAVVERQPIAIADVSQSDLFDALLQDPQRRELQAALLARFRAWLAVPLMMQDEMYGGLVLYYPDTREFSAEEISLAVSLSDQAALAIENARLHEQASQLATLQERQRLARELHDSVSQALYGIALGAHTARAQLERDPHKAIEPLDYVLTLADAGLTEMRALIFELRPESLAQEGLVVALTKQAAALRARHQLTVRTALGTESKVALAVKEVFYRIAQESFHNIVKHARAKCVEVRLTQSDGVLTLEVQDDGRGFVPRREFPGHLGLQSMRERVASVGGTLDIESAQGQGTRIRASVPVEWATA